MLANSAHRAALGMIVFSMGISAAQQLRVAAAGICTGRASAGLALGFIATGSLVGIVLSPLVMGLADIIAARTGQNALGLPWLMMPVLILGGMVLVTFVRPDPKEIGMHLERYYPDYVPPPKPAAGAVVEFNSWDLLRENPDAACDPLELRRAGQHGDRHGADLAGAVASRLFAHLDRDLALVPCRRHVRLHDPARLGVRPRYGREWVMYPGVGTRADRRAVRGLLRGLSCR